VTARAGIARGATGARRALALVAVALLAVAAVLAPAARADKAVPFLAGRVVDEAGMLSAAAKQRIEARLADLEKQTGDQVAVLIVASLDGEPLEDYTVKVAETWKLGQKGKDNGVLLFISRDDRKMRIEVGYGLEPKLTDLQSHQILDEVIRPRFQQGDFDGGVEQGVDAIAKLLSGEALPPRPAAPTATAMPLAQRAVGGLVFLVVIGLFSSAAVGIRGCVSWFLYLFLAPFYFVFPLAFAGPTVALVAVLAWLVGFPALKYLAEKRGWRGWSGGSGGRWGGFGGFGGFGGGGFGGWSGGGGGGFDGGGFSGGGGSFGGGGASGGW
jgi:uncharacterized protein